ncbi:MAG: hypothetical protein ACK5TR_04550 [Alphaproteobacteria bacterium]|jgi:hypothetical protein|nr:hypothetical protein [Alphaproteobacteria bacterium]
MKHLFTAALGALLSLSTLAHASASKSHADHLWDDYKEGRLQAIPFTKTEEALLNKYLDKIASSLTLEKAHGALSMSLVGRCETATDLITVTELFTHVRTKIQEDFFRSLLTSRAFIQKCGGFEPAAGFIKALSHFPNHEAQTLSLVASHSLLKGCGTCDERLEMLQALQEISPVKRPLVVEVAETHFHAHFSRPYDVGHTVRVLGKIPALFLQEELSVFLTPTLFEACTCAAESAQTLKAFSSIKNPDLRHKVASHLGEEILETCASGEDVIHTIEKLAQALGAKL